MTLAFLQKFYKLYIYILKKTTEFLLVSHLYSFFNVVFDIPDFLFFLPVKKKIKQTNQKLNLFSHKARVDIVVFICACKNWPRPCNNKN